MRPMIDDVDKNYKKKKKGPAYKLRTWGHNHRDKYHKTRQSKMQRGKREMKKYTTARILGARMVEFCLFKMNAHIGSVIPSIINSTLSLDHCWGEHVSVLFLNIYCSGTIHIELRWCKSCFSVCSGRFSLLPPGNLVQIIGIRPWSSQARVFSETTKC